MLSELDLSEIKKDGSYCPVCGMSEGVERLWDNMDWTSDNDIEVLAKCCNCKYIWTEIYKLSEVRE